MNPLENLIATQAMERMFCGLEESDKTPMEIYNQFMDKGTLPEEVLIWEPFENHDIDFLQGELSNSFESLKSFAEKAICIQNQQMINGINHFKTKFRPIKNPNTELKVETIFFDSENELDKKFIREGYLTNPKAIWSVSNELERDLISPGYNPEADLWIITTVRWQDPQETYLIIKNRTKIHVEGGLVQKIEHGFPGSYEIHDYDTDGMEWEKLTELNGRVRNIYYPEVCY